MSADHNMTPTDDCPASFIDGECNDGSDANCDDDRSSSTSSWYTPTSSICAIVSNAHSTYRSGRTRSISYRKSQLRGMLRLMNENSNELSNALHRDMGQGRMYVAAFEIDVLRTRCRTALNNLDDWTRTSNVLTPWPFNLSIPIRSEISIEPRGVVTIITPWNMPLLLSLSPLIDALASGNVCILKMSELSVRTTRLLSSLLTSGAYVDADVVNVINGDAETCTELLKYRVDAISYTGGTKIGRIIASAAAYHLTPTLLELGGKNPCFVTRHAHLRSAALRICWGKITGNAGQMCICPDYVLVEECVKEEFVKELKRAMDEMYPISSYANDDDADNVGDGGDGVGTTIERRRGDVGRMISSRHAERVIGLIDSTCDVIYGGRHHDVGDRFVSPTIVEATSTSTIMTEEIFGPILAVMSIPSVDDALTYVHDRFTSRAEHPLVLYIFSHSKYERRRIMDAVPSGMCSMNEVLKVGANINIPFGGVGNSGMGASGGKYGFDFYSHRRGTLIGGNTSTSMWDPTVWVITPPFNDWKLLAFKFIAGVPSALDYLRPMIATFVVPLAIGWVCLRVYPDILTWR